MLALRSGCDELVSWLMIAGCRWFAGWLVAVAGWLAGWFAGWLWLAGIGCVDWRCGRGDGCDGGCGGYNVGGGCIGCCGDGCMSCVGCVLCGGEPT